MNSQQQQAANFSDLDDEIIADDWLVPRREISRRRLLKRTPRHNIYKADWFGDVLVYEPTTRVRTSPSASRQPPRAVTSEENARTEELRLRLANLNLDMGRRQQKSIPIKRQQASIASDSDQVDSAYSSISSTPHYHSKSLNATEFEFPSSQASPSLSVGTCEHQSSSKINSPRSPVILNKDSYVFDFTVDDHEINQDGQSNREQAEKRSAWQELNELRLIAHEGFMLFMGASVGEQSSSLGGAPDASAALVMQMNHPKAVSLHNLLHLSCTTPQFDRFTFNHTPQKQYQQLGVAARLNICQQIRHAMTYLHDKNIVHGALSSVNIYIEPNQTVKISLIDNDERPLAASAVGTTTAEFNGPALSYLSPELIRTLRVGNNHTCETPLVQIDTNQLTKRADVFAFGTILFELFHERRPFEELSAAELIYRIGSGQMDAALTCVQHWSAAVCCPSLVQQTISACWSQNPLDRPHFKQLYFETN